MYTAGLGKIATQDFARYDTMLSTNNTNWESFGELSIDNMGNHAWTAYPSYILPRYVGGIHPSSGGFETVDIKPVTGGLEWARTSIPTIKRTITTNWNVVSENQFTMEVTIPANVTAKIYVPDNDMDQLVVSESGVSVFENNHFISGVDGLQQAEKQDGYIIFTAGSGTYSFQVTGEPLHTPDIGEEEETGIVIDDQATYTNEWVHETASNHNDRYGDGFHYIGWVSGEPTASATYTTTIEEDGEYDVFAWWGVHSNRATNTPYTIHCGNVTETIRKNQEINGGQWNLLGTYTAKAGDTISIVITNDADEYVIADAVRIAPHQDADDTFTPLQQLQLLVYQMELADTSNCIDEIYAEQFKQVLAHAQELCDTQSQDETEITKTITDLQTAYDQMMANKKVNLALNQSVSASESVQSPGMWGTEYLTDGYKAKDDAGRIGYTTDAYHSQVLENPIDITLNLGQQQQVNQVVLYPRLSVGSWEGKTANFPTDYEIQVSNDGTNFQTVVSVQNQPDPMRQPVTWQFDSTTAQYIRIHVTKLGEYAAGESIPDNPTPYRLQFTEIEVYNVPVSEQTTNKSILKTVIKYAENAKASEEYGNAIESVQKSFDEALANAKAVAENNSATQEEVDAAWQTLLNEIHKLGFIAGDKTTLASLIEAANKINAELDRYVETGKSEFIAALEAAQGVYQDGDAMQVEINEVADNLLNAMLNLRYKADKSILKEVVAEAGKVDANAYTTESYAVLTAAVNEANAVLENENATQEEVDAAVENVQSAMDGLVAIEETAIETPSTDNNTVQTGQETTTTKSNAAKTGDFAPIVSLAALGLSSAALLIFRKKK